MAKKVSIPDGMIKSGGYEDLMKSLDEVGTISIQPYISKKDNMGLENYNMVLFPKTKYTEDLSCVTVNGVTRYITGLDEFAPEVMNISDPEEKQIKIKTIRETVSYLEKVLSANDVDPEDKDFWNKVKTLRSDNGQFWSKVRLEIGNEIITLYPKKDPNDLILLMAIEAGGFSTVAKSLDAARNAKIEPKFYLNKRIVTATKSASLKRIKNKAVSILNDLYENMQEKMFYVAKVIDLSESAYKKSTPKELIYDFLDDYIEGKSYEKSQTAASQKFIEVCNLDMETLKLKAVIKDAISYRIIATKPDGSLYHISTNSFIGKNQKDALAYMKQISNEDVMREVLKEVEANW